MLLAYTQTLLNAKSEALDTLLRIVRESDSETQIRLAAAAILRLPIPSDPEPAASARSAPPQRVKPSAIPSDDRAAASGEPLTQVELAALARFLPGVNASRFLKKHTPAYWRDVLIRAQAAPPNRQAA